MPSLVPHDSTMKRSMIEARSGLETVDEYVTKMRNRVDYLQKSEKRMINKIDRMSDIMQKRE